METFVYYVLYVLVCDSFFSFDIFLYVHMIVTTVMHTQWWNQWLPSNVNHVHNSSVWQSFVWRYWTAIGRGYTVTGETRQTKEEGGRGVDIYSTCTERLVAPRPHP